MKSKYQVRAEGRPGAYLMTKEVVKKMAEEFEGEEVHCMIAANGWIMIGADRTKKQFYDFIDNGLHKDMQVEKIALTIPPQVGHCIAIPMDKLYLFDLWKIGEEDIEIIT